MFPIQHGIMQSQDKLLLDLFNGASIAYSLRKLNTNYSGNVIKVRRSNDNTEQNIGFVNGVLDETALTNFVGANSGYITTWYDQSGNANDATQSTQASQPRIVSSGTIDKLNNKPVIYFDGSDDFLSLTSVDSTGDWSIYEAKKRTASGTIDPVISNPTASGAHYPLIRYSDQFAYIANSTGYKQYAHGGEATYKLVSSYNISGTLSAYGNNSLIGFTSTFTSTRNGSGFSSLCKVSGAYSTGYYAELILYTSDKSANNTLINNNINGFYSIF